MCCILFLSAQLQVTYLGHDCAKLEEGSRCAVAQCSNDILHLAKTLVGKWKRKKIEYIDLTLNKAIVTLNGVQVSGDIINSNNSVHCPLKVKLYNVAGAVPQTNASSDLFDGK